MHGELKKPKAIGVTGEGNFTLVGKIGKREQHGYANGIVAPTAVIVIQDTQLYPKLLLQWLIPVPTPRKYIYSLLRVLRQEEINAPLSS